MSDDSIFGSRERNWPTGNYCGKCHDCGNSFTGHKYTLRCRPCDRTKIKDVALPQQDQREPRLHSYDPTPARHSVYVIWPDGERDYYLREGAPQSGSVREQKPVSAYLEAMDICRSLVTWCDDNPPAGEALYFVKRARDLLDVPSGTWRCPDCGNVREFNHRGCKMFAAPTAQALQRARDEAYERAIEIVIDSNDADECTSRIRALIGKTL